MKSQIFTTHKIVTSLDTLGTEILSSHDDNTVRLWDSRDSNTKGKWYEGHTGFVSKTKFSNFSDNLFASTCYDAKWNLFVWDKRCEWPLYKMGGSEYLKVFGLDWKD